MKITSINEFKKYLAENHMDFGDTASSAENDTKLPNFEITGYSEEDEEDEPEPFVFSGEDLLVILQSNLEIATNADDFVNKVAMQIIATGDISKLSDEDEHKLVTWYMEQNGETADESNETETTNPLMKYSTFEELKNILFDVKIWHSPTKAPLDLFEPAEGTTPGEEGYYWSLGLKYLGNEDGVYQFKDPGEYTGDYIVEIDAADLATDVREHEAKDFGADDDTNENADDLISQIDKLDRYIHEYTPDGTTIKKLQAVIDKYVGEYNPEKQDGVDLRDTLADANLSREKLTALIAELTDLKNTITDTSHPEMYQSIDKVINYLGEEYGLKDSAHEGDIKTAMSELGINSDNYFTIKQELEDKGWMIESE